MRTLQIKDGAFEKVGECLYRYSNGVYYARIKIDGKEIKRSLKTTNRDFDKRKLVTLREEKEQIDRSQGKLTLAELCDRFIKTVQYQKPKTVERKSFIVGRIKREWPTGKLTQVRSIKPSDVDLWLSRCRFGSASRNLHFVRQRSVQLSGAGSHHHGFASGTLASWQ